MNKTLLPLWLLCLCLLPSCKPEMRATSQPSVEADGPKALLSRLQAANTHWDYDALLACMEPAERHNFQFVLDEAKRYTDKVRQVQELIQQRIGKGQGRKFHEAIFPGLFTSPFGQAGEHGRLNWSKIQVSVNGDLASVRIDAPDAMDFKLRRVDGQWYLTGDYYLRRAGADGLTWYSREFKRHIQTLEGVEADVESGVITKGNFDKRFQKPK